MTELGVAIASGAFIAAAAGTGIAAWVFGSIDKAVRSAWCKPAPEQGRSRP